MSVAQYKSGSSSIQIDQSEPASGGHAALVVLHGSGGSADYWLSRFAPMVTQAGLALYAPHYFDKTGAQRPTIANILDGRHFGEWLAAVKDAVTYVASRPRVDASRIGVLGISLGAYLAVALGAEDTRIRAVAEISGGVPLGWEERISSLMPPTLILHGDADDVVPVAEAYKLEALLKGCAAKYQMEIFPDQTHWFDGTGQFALLMRSAGFLQRYLLGGSTLRKAG